MAVKKRFPARVATVYCNGGCRAVKKMDYSAEDCQQASALCEDGPLACTAGCLGCGSCVNACRFEAIHINQNGVAEVDEEKCIDCGLCARKCPRQLIRIRLQGNCIVPLCSNTERGFDPKTKTGARTVCAVSCIFGNSARSAHSSSLSASQAIYETRVKLSKLFHCNRADHVVFTCNATEALNIAIHGLIGPGDHVISTDLEHNSVLRPCLLGCPDEISGFSSFAGRYRRPEG